MKSKKSVPQKMKDKPTIDAFMRRKESAPGSGKQKVKKSKLYRRNKKHGRQHP